MVEKFQKILNKIQSEKGSVVLFGIFKMDEFTDKWSVVFSAQWALGENKNTAFAYLIDLIKSNLNSEESDSIARVGISQPDEHLMDLLLNFKTGTRIQEQAVNGNIIHDGYILASNRPARS